MSSGKEELHTTSNFLSVFLSVLLSHPFHSTSFSKLAHFRGKKWEKENIGEIMFKTLWKQTDRQKKKKKVDFFSHAITKILNPDPNPTPNFKVMAPSGICLKHLILFFWFCYHNFFFLIRLIRQSTFFLWPLHFSETSFLFVRPCHSKKTTF